MEFFYRIILEFSHADDWLDKRVLQKTSSSFGMYLLTLSGKRSLSFGGQDISGG